MNTLTEMNQMSEFLIYKTPEGKVSVEVFIKDENLWLTQKRMAELFGVNENNITYHLQEIFSTWELEKSSTTQKNWVVQKEGTRVVNRKIDFYNLDAIIAVGYRVNSRQATQFRIWATQTLKEYIIKWFVMDDERLKNPEYIFGQDYFEEQLERIRDIRSSERRFYQKITDIYAQCSADYDSQCEITQNFFATVQNKLHRAITGLTASEIIYTRVDSDKHNIWLTNWKYGPKGKIRKTDLAIAKNYLHLEELDMLNRIVTMYLDYAELQAKKHKLMYMTDWISKLDAFLVFNEQDILEHNSQISHEVALALAEEEFEKFTIQQDKNYVSDFDLEIQKISK